MSTKEALYAPFNVQSRRGRGGVYQYVTSKDIMNRMNEVFGTNWSSEVLFQDVIGNNVVVRVRVTIFDPAGKNYFYQEGFGGAINDQNAEAGNPFKSAYSKALKDACKKWGVGLYLDEDDLPTEVSSDPAPNMTSNKPSGYSGFETGPAPSAPPQASQSAPAAPQVPAQSGPVPQQSNGPSFTPPSPQPAQSQPVREQPAQPSFTPPPAPAAPSAPPADDKPMGSYQANGPSMISDVQKAALNGLLVSRNVPYEELSTEAFQAAGWDASNVPSKDQLTYDQAVVIIKYGNDKFRRG